MHQTHALAHVAAVSRNSRPLIAAGRVPLPPARGGEQRPAPVSAPRGARSPGPPCPFPFPNLYLGPPRLFPQSNLPKPPPLITVPPARPHKRRAGAPAH